MLFYDGQSNEDRHSWVENAKLAIVNHRPPCSLEYAGLISLSDFERRTLSTKRPPSAVLSRRGGPPWCVGGQTRAPSYASGPLPLLLLPVDTSEWKTPGPARLGPVIDRPRIISLWGISIDSIVPPSCSYNPDPRGARRLALHRSIRWFVTLCLVRFSSFFKVWFFFTFEFGGFRVRLEVVFFMIVR